MTFPFIAAAVEKDELTLHGAYFGVASGRSWCAIRKPAQFEPA